MSGNTPKKAAKRSKRASLASTPSKTAAAPAATTPWTIGEFRVLGYRLEGEKDIPRYVYYKEHVVRREDPLSPKGRTLFVLNPPLQSEVKGRPGCWGTENWGQGSGPGLGNVLFVAQSS